MRLFLFQYCPACFVHHTWIVFEMAVQLLLFGVLLPGLVQFSSSLFYMSFVSVKLVPLYTATARKKFRFILS